MILERTRQVVSDEESLSLWQHLADMELFLRALRQRGALQVESIRAVRRLANVDLGAAKEIVHKSKAWADLQEADRTFQEALFASASCAGFVEKKPAKAFQSEMDAEQDAPAGTKLVRM